MSAADGESFGPGGNLRFRRLLAVPHLIRIELEPRLFWRCEARRVFLQEMHFSRRLCPKLELVIAAEKPWARQIARRIVAAPESNVAECIWKGDMAKLTFESAPSPWVRIGLLGMFRLG